ncbi:conserved hypothetical protein [uncultured Defluviicoccus sp.]|uniref:Phage protein D n=1 Tax=metagenome TaxID=256318 RepID=A0A380T904_9ZZZZ|nr:conserved hypothetical protein [uncultured Defluviicoccus sp.]
MRLTALETRYGGFYAPAFSAIVGGQDLVRDLFLPVTQVEVDLKQRTANRFSFTVANAFDWEAREFVAGPSEQRINLLELFAFGTRTDIAMGYGDPAKLRVMISGTITEIGTSFAEGGAPALTISGYDGLFPLTVGQKTRHWEERRDSDVVLAIASEAKLSATVVQTDPVKRRVDQNQQTDLDFIGKLAERNYATFLLNRDGLYFGPRRQERSGLLELTWGQGLLSFSPQVNLAKQVTAVEVYGQPAEVGEPIVGRARRGEETGRDTSRQSGGDRLARALGEEHVMRVRLPVHTQAEADARARAILRERAQEFVQADGESVGLPDIEPDTNIALTGIGRVFSKTYYVSEATHKVDSSGYRTTFKVEEPTV